MLQFSADTAPHSPAMRTRKTSSTINFTKFHQRSVEMTRLSYWENFKAAVWDGVTGRNGVGKINSNGLRLLTLCSEFNLTITNTNLCMKIRYKTSWIHPRSKHWHLLNYVIVRKSDPKFVKITYTTRNTKYSTDHTLIVFDIALELRPSPRQQELTSDSSTARLCCTTRLGSSFRT